jgi:hypothetical protein
MCDPSLSDELFESNIDQTNIIMNLRYSGIREKSRHIIRCILPVPEDKR